MVGAGLSALRTAEALRANAYTGEIAVFGAETHPPYNRPPLSKSALREGAHIGHLQFKHRPSLDNVQWHLGMAVVDADLPARSITLNNGDTVSYDGLIVASGLRPRRLPFGAAVRQVLRTVEDACVLRALLMPAASVIIIGAGFIGCEVAATARAMGCDVTVVAADAYPLLRPLGKLVGAEVRRRHENDGVQFRLGVGIRSIEQHGPAATAIELSDGEVLRADVIVEAIGSDCNTEWLAGTGLDLADGIATDGLLRAIQPDGTALDGVHVVGDLARFPNALFDDIPRRVEHWSNATDTGRRAGMALANFLSSTNTYDAAMSSAFGPMPVFWSEQGALRLDSFGMPGLADTTRILEGDLTDRAVVGYYRREELAAVVSVDMLPRALGYQREISEGRRG